ncbi:MAG TPA: XdhC family protein [Solirubrobacteraceae bacterium]|nr:XdhC family protein [Solirubrobacteraceae bacterium]
MIKGDLAERVARLSEERTPFVVATVVRAVHPTSVRPGFSALVLADGTIDGFVGGNCAESSVRLHSLRALETGEAVLLRIVPGEDPDSPELTGPFEHAVVEHNPCLSGGALEIFLEPQLPPRRVMIVGATPVARALARIATAAGLDVTTGGVPGSADAAVVVASHGTDEEEVLASALTAGVPYVALVASRIRGEAVRESLDVPAELRAQLHTPAGLDIGARSPEEIAISILAELIAEHHAHPAPDVVESFVDPICGMTVAVSDATPFFDCDDGRIYFCGAGCRDAFAAQHA